MNSEVECALHKSRFALVQVNCGSTDDKEGRSERASEQIGNER